MKKDDVAYILGFLAALSVWPLVIIWALNTLFSVGIPVTFPTWFAVLVIVATLRAPSNNT